MSQSTISKHQLSLEFPCYSGTDYLAIDDTSNYAGNLQVKCPTLQIIPPGFDISVDIIVAPGFRTLFTACDLTLQTSDCGNRWPLPDGLYTIKYSVSPNDRVWIEYSHIRVAGITQQYEQALANVDLDPNDPAPEVKQRLKDLRLIKSFIDASKAMVEYRDQPQKGNDLYMYAQKQLNKIYTEKQF